MIRAAVVLLALAVPAGAQDRVLAIGGSVTETIFAVGQGHRLVARDNTSSRPKRWTCQRWAICAPCRPRACCRSPPT
ncbi:hypothetical protein [Paracoccus hibiscisoli]|uniref:hypothetical protein n=1 Tax=Paracoccus hibiscisoli TaxID=2023261 RepID=UPI0026D10C02